MIRFKYRKEQGSFGVVLRPVADVILEKDDFQVEVPMYIDSGADISMIPLRFGRALGFLQNEKDIIQEIKGVTGAGLPYILKEVILSIGNKKIKIQIAWALVEEVPILMGRMDIFNKFQITFNEARKWISFEELSQISS